MIGIARDCVRAVLVLVVLAVGLEMLQAHREAAGRLPQAAGPVAPAWQPVAPPPAWQPMQTVVIQPPPPAQPIRRVAGSLVDLADSMLGVIR